MSQGFYPSFDVVVIDVRGLRRPYPLATIIVTNVRTAAVLASLTTTAEGVIVEGSYTGADILVGDILEFSHATFTGKFRYTLAATQAAAYGTVDNTISTFVVGNLFATMNNSPSAELFFLDTGDAAAKPYKISDVKKGVTNYVPFQSTLTKAARLYLISKDVKNQLSGTDFSQASFVNVTIPATGGAAFKTLFDRYADATTTGTALETLYNNVIPAGTLANIGDKILFKYAGKYAANANAGRFVFVLFAGQAVAESDDITANGTKWQIDGSFIRIDADSIRYESEFTAEGQVPHIREGQVDALNFTFDYEMKFQGRTTVAAGDLTATLGYAYFVPAAMAEPNYLTFLGEALTFDGSALKFTP